MEGGSIELHDGIITSLVSKGSGGERFGVHIDGHFALELAAVLVEEADLRRGEVLTVQQQAALLERDQSYRAKGVALSMLAQRARCRVEVERKLRRSGFAEQVVDETVAWLEAQGYLDDRSFAALYAEERLRCGWGRRRIVAELGRMGIPRGMVEGEVWDDLRPSSETSAAREDLVDLVERRFARRWEDDPDKTKRKIAGFLARRGHEWDEITEIIRLVAERAGRE